MKAVTLHEIGKIPADSVVTVIMKGSHCIVHYKQVAEPADPRFDFVIIPETWEIQQHLRKISGGYGVHWSSEADKYHVVGFRFGLATRISVPVFEKGKIIRNRFVTTTKHVDIHDASLDTLFRKLFRACASGRLYAHYPKGRLERLFWDSEFNQFSTQTVSKDSITL